MFLHSSINQCYNMVNKNSSVNTPIPHYCSSEGIFLGVAIVAYLLLRLRSQCVNNATIQPLMTVVDVNKISSMNNTSSLRLNMTPER